MANTPAFNQQGGLKLSEAVLLTRMNEAVSTFHVTNASQQKTPPRVVDKATVDGCLGNAPSVDYWSEAVFHYYCQFGNLRACFSGQARQNSKDYAGYEKSFNFCANGDKDFQWITADKEREAIFKHVMFTVYAAGNVSVYDPKQTDAVINKFYGVTGPTDCSKRYYTPRDKNKDKYGLYRDNGKHCGL